jgi:hypothetical protein
MVNGKVGTTHGEGRWGKVGVVQAMVGFPFNVVWAEERIGRDVVFYFGFDDGRRWNNTGCGEDVLKNWLEAVFVDGVVGCFLADLSAAEVVVPVDVVCPAAFTGRRRCWMIDREEEFALEHEEKVDVAETVLGVATRHVDERIGHVW